MPVADDIFRGCAEVTILGWELQSLSCLPSVMLGLRKAPGQDLGCGAAGASGLACEFPRGSRLLNSFSFSRNTWFPGEHRVRISDVGRTLLVHHHTLQSQREPEELRPSIQGASHSQPRASPDTHMLPSSPFSPDEVTQNSAKGRECSHCFKNTLRGGAGLWLPGGSASFMAWMQSVTLPRKKHIHMASPFQEHACPPSILVDGFCLPLDFL